MKKIGKLKTYSSKEIEKSYVGIDFCCLDRELFNPDKCYDLLGESGIKYARCQTGWARCEKEKGVYDFSWLDSVVDNLMERGVEPWFNLGYGNPIYMPDTPNPTAVGCVPIYYGEEALSAWCNYVKVLTQHFCGRVKHYEIWNEPDGSQFWYPKVPSGAEYAKFVNLCTKIIKECDQNAKIGVNIADPRGFTYIESMLDNLEKGSLDVFSYHAYTSVPEFRINEVIAQLRKMLKERGFTDVELWQGEAGYPSWAYEGHWLVKEGCDDERAQAVFQLRRYFIDIFNGAKLSSFFQMADMWEKPYDKATETLDKCAAHGILNGLTYTPKKSYETICYLSTIFSGDIKPTDDYMILSVSPKSPIDLIACRKMTFEKNGIPLYAYYYPSDLAKHEDIPFEAIIGVLRKIDEPVLIDPLNGDVFELTEPSSKESYYYKLPLKDYPMILTDKRVFEIV